MKKAIIVYSIIALLAYCVRYFTYIIDEKPVIQYDASYSVESVDVFPKGEHYCYYTSPFNNAVIEYRSVQRGPYASSLIELVYDDIVVFYGFNKVCFDVKWANKKSIYVEYIENETKESVKLTLNINRTYNEFTIERKKTIESIIMKRNFYLIT